MASLEPIFHTENDWRLAPALAGEELREFWERVWDVQSNSLSNSHADRLLAAWRLVRAMAKVRGVLQDEESVEEIRFDQALNSHEFTSFVEVKDPVLRKRLAQGVPMSPPDVPAQMLLTNGQVSGDYDPREDDVLNRFVGLVTFIGQGMLALEQCKSSRRGFAWFTNPDTIRAGWPSITALSKFENEIVSQAIDILIGQDTGPDPDPRAAPKTPRQLIAERWELTPPEVELLTTLAVRGQVMRVRLDDRDGTKALLLGRLEQLAERAKQALDHRGGAMVLREMWRIYSDRGEDAISDEFEEMANVLTISAAEKRRQLSNNPKDPQ